MKFVPSICQKPYIILLAADIADRDISQIVKKYAEEIEYFESDRGLAGKVYVDPPVKMKSFIERLESMPRRGKPYLVTRHFEGDVRAERRYLIDTGRSYTFDGRILYFDIEIDPRGNFRPNNPDGRILSIAAVDREGKEYFICDDREEKIILEFNRILRNYSAVAGWYSLHFDVPYLRNRGRKIGTLSAVTRYDHVDLLSIYRDLFKRTSRSFSLGEVAKHEGIEGKYVEIGRYGNVDEILEWFENDRFTLRKYNVRDAVICRELDRKLNLSDIFFKIVEISHTVPWEVLVPKLANQRDINFLNVVDSLVLHFAGRRKPRMIFPSREFVELPVQHFEGALTLPVVPGMHENVIVVDFKSMYPAIMRSWNMGPETYCEDDSGEYKAVRGSYRGEPESIFVEVINHITERLEYYKGEMKKYEPGSLAYQAAYSRRFAFKKVLLSLYGSIAFPGSRFHSLDTAENITALGRDMLGVSARFLKRYGQVVGGDTDSVFVEVESVPDLLQLGQEMVSALVDEVRAYTRRKYNVEFLGDVEVDRIYSRMLFTNARKKYAGRVTWEGGPCNYVHIIGFELLRGDTCEAVADFQRKLITMRLDNATRSEIEEYVAATRRSLMAGELDLKLVTFRRLSKNLDEYKTTTPYVRAARELINKRGRLVTRGSKVAYIKTGPRKEDILPVADESFTSQLDAKAYTYIWKKNFLPIAQRLGIHVTGVTTLGSFGLRV